MSKRDTTPHQLQCSFCHKSQREVKKLIAGPTVYICDECIRLCNDIIAEETKDSAKPEPLQLPTPHEIRDFLDRYIIGQDYAKKVLSVAVYNHYRRINAKSDAGQPEIAKSNILLVGPTGTGKTLLAQSLARFLKVPFAIADATTLTEAGYVGEDVESVVQNLLASADNDVERCERGIIYLDEIDKIARKSEGPSVTRDVSGEGVQQGLLKLIEGTKANITPRGAKKYGPQDATVQVDTSNILFICGGAFVGIDSIIERRIGKKSIGFGADVKAKKDRRLGETLKEVSTDDLTAFGLIPEFVGRLPVVATLSDVSEDDLVTILQEPKNSLIKQYKKLFAMENVELEFTDGALRAVSKEAIKRKSGARGLRAVLESAMLDIMYEVPYIDGIRACVITEEVITKGAPPTLRFEKNDQKQSA